MTSTPSHRLISTSLALAALLSASASTLAQGSGRPIPQPDASGLPVTSGSRRVDLNLPSFSNPTKITNPLFPISSQESVLLLGVVDGKAFRTEVTLLPYTRTITWNGSKIEAAVSQYNAFLDGKIAEVAIDLYAQADDGSVWYLGEDVSDFEDGVIVSKEGTWTAGVDGPPCMIMPAKPKLGDVYRSENMPGIAFEEVTVKAVDQVFDGPFGPLKGGVIGKELHMDGATEDKQFAPGYGEFYTGEAGGDIEALAIAVPTDKASGNIPVALDELPAQSLAILDATAKKDWKTVESAFDALTKAKSALSKADIPQLVGPRLVSGLSALSKAIALKHAARTRGAAIDVARLSYDMQLRYLPRQKIDIARLHLWSIQLADDAAVGHVGDVRGDTFAMALIRDRILAGLDPAKARRLNEVFGSLLPGAKDGEFGAVQKAAANLSKLIPEL